MSLAHYAERGINNKQRHNTNAHLREHMGVAVYLNNAGRNTYQHQPHYKD